MGRYCSDCSYFLTRHDFSYNQWRKGDGFSRCKGCVTGDGDGGYAAVSYVCHECGQSYANQNELNMHSQVHRPRSVACPVCGEVRFRSGANAVQHVESGYCTGCLGADNARDQIYRFASGQRSMNRYMTEAPRLTYGDGSYGGVPDTPYHCPDCSKSFRQLSQLLQHQDQKHNNTRMISY